MTRFSVEMDITSAQTKIVDDNIFVCLDNHFMRPTREVKLT